LYSPTLKQAYHCTSAELVYGTTLRIPGEFFTSNSNATVSDPSNYVVKLKESMQHLRASLPREQQKRQTFVSDHLQTCTHAFVRRDAVKKPLQAPYDGPYEILN